MKKSELETADMLAYYINHDLKIRGMERSLLDSIAAFQIGKAAVTKGGFSRWLNKGDLRKHKNRGLINAISQSPKVKEIYSLNANKDLDASFHLVCEHVVPITEISKIMRDEKKVDGSISAEKILKIHENFYRRCIVTKDEDNKLTKEKLGRKMPPGWSKGDDIYARYSQVFSWADTIRI